MKKFFSWVFKPRQIKVETLYDSYEIVTRHLKNSKYCGINADEEDFIRYLLIKLTDNNLKKAVKLERTSRKDIHFFYNGYPIGRIKLNGKKHWMSVNSNVLKKFEDLTLEQFKEAINYWIKYIKTL